MRVAFFHYRRNKPLEKIMSINTSKKLLTISTFKEIISTNGMFKFLWKDDEIHVEKTEQDFTRTFLFELQDKNVLLFLFTDHTSKEVLFETVIKLFDYFDKEFYIVVFKKNSVNVYEIYLKS